jgi:hypothetical protein
LRAWQPYLAPGQAGRPGWLPVWSVPAGVRALRAAVVVPSLFALTFNVIGDAQMALLAVFGSFATLVMASFGGSWRDKVIAHLGLAVIGSVALTIGTVVSGTAWLAVIVTVPVASAGGVGTVPSGAKCGHLAQPLAARIVRASRSASPARPRSGRWRSLCGAAGAAFLACGRR